MSGLTDDIFTAIYTALDRDPAAARQQLADLGVSKGSIDALERCKQERQLPAEQRLRLQVDLCALRQQRSIEDLLCAYLRAGANNAVIESYLGLQPRDISMQRLALGIPSPKGRTPVVDEHSRVRIHALHLEFSAMRRAERLLAIVERMPMWSLSSIAAALA